MAQNRRTAYLNLNPGRAQEISGADWSGGMNLAGGNAIGIGINTGDYSPTVSSWSEHERKPQPTMHLGEDEILQQPIKMEAGDLPEKPFTSRAAFVKVPVDIPPGSNMSPGIPNTINRTGKTIPANSWAWGELLEDP